MIADLKIGSLGLYLIAFWPAAMSTGGINAVQITLSDAFLEELDERLRLLRVLDALISEIPTQWQNDLPSPFQCRLFVYPRGRADQVQKLLPEAMPILSRRQLVTLDLASDPALHHLSCIL